MSQYFRKICLQVLIPYLLIESLALGVALKHQANVEPVFVWTYLDECSTVLGRPVRGNFFIQNPSGNVGNYMIRIRLINLNPKISSNRATILLEGNFSVPPYGETNLVLPVNPPTTGSWRVIISAHIFDPQHYNENYADLIVQ